VPNSLEDWAFTATIAAGFTTVVLSIVVFVQLRLAIRQTRALKDQVQLARESQEQTAESLRISAIAADAARDQVNISDNALQIARESLEQTSESVRIASQAADAARDAALETARARIDDHSPRVVAWDWRPTWPPFLDTVSSYTYQNTSLQIR
jgi:biopolymer transport protein ExbB/TolQ